MFNGLKLVNYKLSQFCLLHRDVIFSTSEYRGYSSSASNIVFNCNGTEQYIKECLSTSSTCTYIRQLMCGRKIFTKFDFKNYVGKWFAVYHQNGIYRYCLKSHALDDIFSKILKYALGISHMECMRDLFWFLCITKMRVSMRYLVVWCGHISHIENI